MTADLYYKNIHCFESLLPLMLFILIYLALQREFSGRMQVYLVRFSNLLLIFCFQQGKVVEAYI